MYFITIKNHIKYLFVRIYIRFLAQLLCVLTSAGADNNNIKGANNMYIILGCKIVVLYDILELGLYNY